MFDFGFRSVTTSTTEGLDDPDLAFASYTDTSCPLD